MNMAYLTYEMVTLTSIMVSSSIMDDAKMRGDDSLNEF